MSLPRHNTPLAELLRSHIRERGPIPFAEYMRECLYHPLHGYYSRAEARRFADYYTSVDVHPIFGRLLARQLAEMWEALGRPARFDAVECGAGTGRLAAHILDFSARALPEFYAALHYTAVEASAARRAQQASLLGMHISAGRCQPAAALPDSVSAGCIFSNELLDALPVHRVVQTAGGLREIRVGLRGDEFCDVVSEQPASPDIAAWLSGQGIRLAEGQQAEVGLEASAWMRAAGRSLQRGFVLTVDYGHDAAELYDAQHMRGTLLAYAAHRASEDWYAAPGEQDLTAHVSFTALDAAGAQEGLSRSGLVSQTHFLLALGRGNEFADLYDGGMTEAEKLHARLLLKTLIYPEGMGERFCVLIHHKAVADVPVLAGLQAL